MLPLFSDLQDLQGRTRVVGILLNLDLPDISADVAKLKSLSVDQNVDCEGEEAAFNIWGLSEGKAANGVYFRFHAHEKSPKSITHVSIRIGRKPKNEPPKIVGDGNALSGGYPNVLASIFSAIETVEEDVSAEGRFLYVVKKPLFPVYKKENSYSLRLSAKTLSFEGVNPYDSDSELDCVVTPNAPGTVLRIRSKIKVKFGPQCIEEIAQSLWNFTSPIYDESR